MVPINSNKFLIPGRTSEDDDGVAPARSGQIPRVHATAPVLSVCRWPNGLTSTRMLGAENDEKNSPLMLIDTAVFI